MVDNIIMKRIWQDKEFFELFVTCTNSKIIATTEVYVTDKMIDELHDMISEVINFKSQTVMWTSGCRGEQSTSCIEFSISMQDLNGHILIEVFMEINDGGSLDKHHCCFYLNTELGMLEEFSKNILELKEKRIGKTISLVP